MIAVEAEECQEHLRPQLGQDTAACTLFFVCAKSPGRHSPLELWRSIVTGLQVHTLCKR